MRDSINVVTGESFLSTSPLRLAPIATPGIPPVLVKDLQMQNGTIMHQDTAVGTVQVFLSIADEGIETGCLQQEGNVARVTRSVLCCVEGTAAKIQRTGTLPDMVGYMRLANQDFLYAVVTPIEKINDTWHLSLVACQIWKDPNMAEMFNTYWKQLLTVFKETCQRETIALDKSWTPLKRQKRIREEEGSSNTSTPVRSVTPSPMKFGAVA